MKYQKSLWQLFLKYWNNFGGKGSGPCGPFLGHGHEYSPRRDVIIENNYMRNGVDEITDQKEHENDGRTRRAKRFEKICDFYLYSRGGTATGAVAPEKSKRRNVQTQTRRSLKYFKYSIKHNRYLDVNLLINSRVTRHFNNIAVYILHRLRRDCVDLYVSVWSPVFLNLCIMAAHR